MNDPVIIALHLGARVDGTRVVEIAFLVGRAALDAHRGPGLQRLLQAGVPIGHHQQWGWQAASLQIRQQPAPRRLRFSGGQLQRGQSFLAIVGHTERGEDRYRDDAAPYAP